jgi:hypothetical protein
LVEVDLAVVVAEASAGSEAEAEEVVERGEAGEESMGGWEYGSMGVWITFLRLGFSYM